MPVYYRGPCAHIDHRYFEVRGPEPRRFALRGLRGVHIVCVPSGRAGSGGATTRLYATGTAGVAAATAWPVLGTGATSVAATIAAAFLVGTRGCWRTRTHSYELHAFYRGSWRLLFATTDERMFEQVRRGLVRAMEYHADTN
ncbi:hypothetical protein Cme02nite_53510 [Catellatospora methionotrophica]|uniref:Uncharacterized protein n=1 Tax=Catellatospora methionotrophica TaxID=121620 RepID=A0A8J3LJX8_9ACTN|nr:DUF6232 family protein [Catellatospora methionotrophica]GIG17019.1 hypothetical protein Cme02nite_53510 [Catellatospora methionotrophica]